MNNDDNPRTISQTTHEKIAADKADVIRQLIENHDKAVVRAKQIQTEMDTIEATAAITQLRYLRGHISELGERVLVFRRLEITHACDINEARANLTLAFRHLEDARMRLGKSIQALDGGVSCYDK